MNKQTKKETYLYTWSDFRVKIAIFHPTKPISVGFFFRNMYSIYRYLYSFNVCLFLVYIFVFILYCVRWTSNTICLDVAFINSCRRSSSKDEGFFLPFPFFGIARSSLPRLPFRHVFYCFRWSPLMFMFYASANKHGTTLTFFVLDSISCLTLALAVGSTAVEADVLLISNLFSFLLEYDCLALTKKPIFVVNVLWFLRLLTIFPECPGNLVVVAMERLAVVLVLTLWPF